MVYKISKIRVRKINIFHRLINKIDKENLGNNLSTYLKYIGHRSKVHISVVKHFSAFGILANRVTKDRDLRRDGWSADFRHGINKAGPPTFESENDLAVLFGSLEWKDGKEESSACRVAS